jgi:hypothetical protein
MPALTRRHHPDRPDCWHVFYDDVHVGTIAIRAGIPHDEDPWGWSCGFYPGSHPRGNVQAAPRPPSTRPALNSRRRGACSCRSGPRPIFKCGASSGIGRPKRNIVASIGMSGCRQVRGMVVYFDFFGTRFFGLGPDRPDGSASSPWHGQASLNASKARVMPGTFNRSGFWSRYRNRTLALSKMLPSAGGHARTSGSRFGEKYMAVSIIPSHAPADRASPSSWNEPSTSSSQYLCASAPVSTTVPLAVPMTESATLATMK